MSPDEAFSCRFDRRKSRGVAPSLSLLAPCLAPRTRHAPQCSKRPKIIASTACVAGALAVDGSDSIASVRLGAGRASSWPAIATASDRAETSRTERAPADYSRVVAMSAVRISAADHPDLCSSRGKRNCGDPLRQRAWPEPIR